MHSIVAEWFRTPNLTCSIGILKAGKPPEIENRHRVNHLRVDIAFDCICVAPCGEVFQGNCAIAVHLGISAGCSWHCEYSCRKDLEEGWMFQQRKNTVVETLCVVEPPMGTVQYEPVLWGTVLGLKWNCAGDTCPVHL